MNRNRPMPEDHAPYHTMQAFDEGITAYMSSIHENPCSDPKQGLATQAWDRDSEYAMRAVRHSNSY
jgi:hypothetical protein